MALPDVHTRSKTELVPGNDTIEARQGVSDDGGARVDARHVCLCCSPPTHRVRSELYVGSDR